MREKNVVNCWKNDKKVSSEKSICYQDKVDLKRLVMFPVLNVSLFNFIFWIIFFKNLSCLTNIFQLLEKHKFCRFIKIYKDFLILNWKSNWLKIRKIRQKFTLLLNKKHFKLKINVLSSLGSLNLSQHLASVLCHIHKDSDVNKLTKFFYLPFNNKVYFFIYKVKKYVQLDLLSADT